MKSIPHLMICNSLRWWKSLNLEGDKRYLMLSLLSSLHIMYLSLGSFSNFRISIFGRIPTSRLSPRWSNTHSRTLQSHTSTSFKFWKLCIKWDGTRLTRHGQLHTLKIRNLQKNSNESWWCHIIFNLGRSSSFNSSKLGNET